MNANAFSEWFRDVDWTAVGTWMLVMVGVIAGRYAWIAARAANETLRLESEPILSVVGLGPNSWLEADDSWAFTNLGHNLKRTTAGGHMTENAGLEITNVGRGAAVNLAVEVAIEPTPGSGLWVSFTLRIAHLRSGEAYILSIQRLNEGFPFRVFARSATRSSFSRPGRLEKVNIASNAVFPITI